MSNIFQNRLPHRGRLSYCEKKAPKSFEISSVKDRFSEKQDFSKLCLYLWHLFVCDMTMQSGDNQTECPDTYPSSSAASSVTSENPTFSIDSPKEASEVKDMPLGSMKRKDDNSRDEEYIRKRARNNVAVKKSRERSKYKILETQKRVEVLTQENEELQTKVTLLTKELNVLRALFTNGGFTLPSHSLDMQLPSHNPAPTHPSVYQGSSSLSPNPRNPPHTVIQHMHHHSSSPLQAHEGHPSSYDSLKNKSAFRALVDSQKVSPLRPTPVIARDYPSSPGLRQPAPSNSVHFTSEGKHQAYMTSMKDSSPYHVEAMAPNSVFSVVHRPSSLLKNVKKEEDLPGVVKTIIRPGPSSVASPYPYRKESPSSSPPMDSLPTTRQETSVIKNISNLEKESPIDSSSHADQSIMNTLGRFCVIQDPQNNGQIKIVPLDS